ncbi:MAG TPA: SHOCT domain-containing protein [Paraburkholderia sp.]|nr:SHOCT domain-containing protein [Paraburkholderia sp.]
MGPLFGPEGLSQLLLIIVIVLVAWLIKVSRDRRADKGETKADAVLRERYARGEISRDEYLQISKDLERR